MKTNMNKIIALVMMIAFATGVSAQNNGRLLYNDTYTANGIYVLDGQWYNNGPRALAQFKIYENVMYYGNMTLPFVGYVNYMNYQCRRYGTNNDSYYMVANNGAVMYYFSFAATYPMLGTVRSTSVSFYDKGNTLANYNNPYQGGGYSTPPTTTTTPNTPTRTPRVCGLCNGRGTVGTEEGVSNYGSDKKKWCADCGRYVYLNHWHKTCPSCNGRGKW